MDILIEQWLPIPGVPDYEASTHGRIRSLDRVITLRSRWGGMQQRKCCGRVLAPVVNVHGYPMVCVGSPAKRVTVHSAVAAAFHGSRPPGAEVNHKDGDKLNSRPDNLEYVSSTVNNHHALISGLRRMKVSDSDIERMRSMYPNLTYSQIADQFGISEGHAAKLIKSGRKVRA